MWLMGSSRDVDECKTADLPEKESACVYLSTPFRVRVSGPKIRSLSAAPNDRA
jgi:hypothetical protein